MAIGSLDSKHLEEVAKLHEEGISTGFISSLGPSFVEQLYRGIMTCSSAFCLVALDQDHVLGFIAGG